MLCSQVRLARIQQIENDMLRLRQHVQSQPSETEVSLPILPSRVQSTETYIITRIFIVVVINIDYDHINGASSSYLHLLLSPVSEFFLAHVNEVLLDTDSLRDKA